MRKQTWEYRLYRVLARVVRTLPERMASATTGGLVVVAQDVFGWRRKETETRIRQVFPDWTDRERKRTRRRALRHLGRNVTELIRPPADLKERVEGWDETFDAFHRALEPGKGVLVAILHSGNWDLAGRRASEEGFPMHLIARQQKNTRLYNELIRTREEGGAVVVDRDDPKLIRKVLGFLADNGMVVIPIDIRARKPARSWQFLGHPAWLSNGLGLLAAKSGAEVLPVYVGRRGRTGHVWKPFPARRLASGSGREERDALLQSCLDDLGGEVLRDPESYFWYNKRWVLQPKEDEED